MCVCVHFFVLLSPYITTGDFKSIYHDDTFHKVSQKCCIAVFLNGFGPHIRNAILTILNAVLKSVPHFPTHVSLSLCVFAHCCSLYAYVTAKDI